MYGSLSAPTVRNLILNRLLQYLTTQILYQNQLGIPLPLLVLQLSQGTNQFKELAARARDTTLVYQTSLKVILKEAREHELLLLRKDNIRIIFKATAFLAETYTTIINAARDDAFIYDLVKFVLDTSMKARLTAVTKQQTILQKIYWLKFL